MKRRGWLRLVCTVALTTTTTATTTFTTRRVVTSLDDHQRGWNWIRTKEDLPILPNGEITEDAWVSLHRTVEFLPNQGLFSPGKTSMQAQKLARQLQRQLEQVDEYEDGEEEEEEKGHSDDVYKVSPFVQGSAEYDEYQQAWRLLGFMIDCDDMDFHTYDDDSNNNGNNNNNHGSGDQGTGEGCHRYVIWAAYVDLEYQGGGIGEYQYWDRQYEKWNTRTCAYDANNNNGGGRCAKMDCHLADTHWSLLGLFKHQSLDDWFGQLFKHEGVCIWSDKEYAFMKNAKGAWPESCTQSSTYTSSGNLIYYDVKPVSGGGIALGLYTDTRCTNEYVPTSKNDPITVENVLGNLLMEDGSGSQDEDYQFNPDDYTLAQSMAMWEQSFDAFKICQPCVAYDVNNVGYNFDDDSMKGSSYGTYRYGYDDDYAYKYYGKQNQGDDFDCYDDAGYTNVNQCMKFMAKTTMQTATFRDLSLATIQGTLVNNPLAGYATSTERRNYYRRGAFGTFLTYVFFFISMTVLGFGIFLFRKVLKEEKVVFKWNPKEPFVYV